MAVLYFCKNISDTSYFEAAWITCRERSPALPTVVAALDVLEREGIDVSKMIYTEQSDCDSEETTTQSST